MAVRRRGRRAHRRPPSPCSCSTSTGSRRSTTPSATTPATGCSRSPPAGWPGPCGPEDTVARLGGDEFAVLLTDVRDAGGRDRGRRADPRGARRALPPRRHDSAGRGQHRRRACTPTHGDRVRAPAAPRRRRDVPGQGGAAPASRSTAGARLHTPDRLGLLGSVRRASSSDELELHYQPEVVASRGGRSVGVEALVRWKHPERGLVFPDEFIDLAEQSGLMRQLTEFVLEKSLAQVALWWRAGIEVPVAVNVSRARPPRRGFADVVAGLLRTAPTCRPSALKLEITEHVLMADPGRCRTRCDALAALGVDLSLDDFGTGYSSLVHLKRLPVSEIKIDRSFVAADDRRTPTTRRSSARSSTCPLPRAARRRRGRRDDETLDARCAPWAATPPRASWSAGRCPATRSPAGCAAHRVGATGRAHAPRSSRRREALAHAPEDASGRSDRGRPAPAHPRMPPACPTSRLRSPATRSPTSPGWPGWR